MQNDSLIILLNASVEAKGHCKKVYKSGKTIFEYNRIKNKYLNIKDYELLLNCYLNDQIPRQYRYYIAPKYLSFKSLDSITYILDSINESQVSYILRKYKKIDSLPAECNRIIFLVIQHGTDIFQEKNAFLINEFYLKKLISSHKFAQFQDRLLIRKKKLQKYGTQFAGKRPWECIPLDSVNYFRNQIGLENVKDYWKSLNIDVDSVGFAELKNLIIRKPNS